MRRCLVLNKSVDSLEVIREKYREAIDSEMKEVSEANQTKKMKMMRMMRTQGKSWRTMTTIAISDKA